MRREPAAKIIPHPARWPESLHRAAMLAV